VAAVMKMAVMITSLSVVTGCWRGYLSGRGADLHMAQLMPLPLAVSCFSNIQIGFTFLVAAQPGNPRQSPEGHKTDLCVCVCSVV